MDTEILTLGNYRARIQAITEESPDERVYQTRVIQPLLECVYPGYQIVDVSWANRTKIHTKKYYKALNWKEYGSDTDRLEQYRKYRNEIQQDIASKVKKCEVSRFEIPMENVNEWDTFLSFLKEFLKL